MLVALCSDKGSPGTTTSALALASAWHVPAIVVEADAAGGDLGIRINPNGNALPEAPTILSLATAARVDREPDLIARHAQLLTPQVSVVVGALRREQMAKVGDWAPVADSMRRSSVPVFADLGQFHSSSPNLPVAAAADLVVVVGRPDITSVVRMRDRLAHLGSDLGAIRGAPPRLYAALVTTTRHGQAHANDVAALLAETNAKPFLTGVGYLAVDHRAVRQVESGDDPRRRLARTNLMRSARNLVAELRVAADVPHGVAGALTRDGAR